MKKFISKANFFCVTCVYINEKQLFTPLKRFLNILVLSVTTLFFIQCTTRTTFEKVLINNTNSVITILGYHGTELIDQGMQVNPGKSIVLYRTSIPGKTMLGGCAELPLELELDVVGHCLSKDVLNNDNWDMVPVGRDLDLTKIRLWQCAFQINEEHLISHKVCQGIITGTQQSEFFDD